MARDPLDLIEQKESRGKNVPNYKYGPGFSASGYYQIIDGTWRRWAKGAGIDISDYPTAMSAPREVQRAVAEYGFQKEGFRPWEAVKHLAGQEANYSPTAHVGAPAKAAADKAVPVVASVEGPLPNSPLQESQIAQLRGLLAEPDPFDKLKEEERKAVQPPVAPQPVAVAPQLPPPAPMAPAAPPPDYAALLLPRLKRGLLAAQGPGGLLG